MDRLLATWMVPILGQPSTMCQESEIAIFTNSMFPLSRAAMELTGQVRQTGVYTRLIYYYMGYSSGTEKKSTVLLCFLPPMPLKVSNGNA